MKKINCTLEVERLHFVDTDGTLFQTSNTFSQAHKLGKKGIGTPIEISFDSMTKPMWFNTWILDVSEDGIPNLSDEGEEQYILVPYTAKITGTLRAILEGPSEKAKLVFMEQPSIPVVGYDLLTTHTNYGA